MPDLKSIVLGEIRSLKKALRLSLQAFIFLLVVSYSNCSPKHQEGQPLSSLNFNAAEVLASLQSQALSVLSSKCASCHVTDYPLSNLDNIMDVTYLTDFGFINPGSPQTSPMYLTLIDKTYHAPDSLSITDNDLAILRDWIAALGGDFNTLIGATEGQTGGVPGAPGTYSQVNTILSQRCFGCHSGGVNIPTLAVGYAQLLTATNRNGQRVVTPGNAADSRLFQVVVTNIMPRAGNPLTSQQKEVIRSWIAAGAPNN